MTHTHDDHSHLPQAQLTKVFIITAVFMVVEFVVGFLANSLALMADAGHMLNDVFSILLAVIAIRVSHKKSTSTMTFGLRRVEVLSGLFNGLSLLFISIFIIEEAIERTFILDELVVDGPMMLIVAVIGLFVNIFGILLLHKEKDHSINVDGAYQHILADLFGSIAAIIAGVGIIWFSAYWLDLVVSVIVSLLVLRSGLSITIRALRILIQAIPHGTDLELLKNEIEELEEVMGIYDLHGWRLTDGFDLITAHIHVKSLNRYNEILEDATELAKKHGYHHVTFQLECTQCSLCDKC
ncbi:MAG: cation transporter [Candidatus Heimdallarchaeota archaeon]|nr:cation transporter [Candidatus Heimdallarchaeota archaeon]